MCHEIYSVNHPDYLLICMTAGSIYDDVGQYSKALNNIGLVYAKIRKFSEAISFHEKALTIHYKIIPPYHPDFDQSYNNIGYAYETMKNHLQAISYDQKALVIKQKSLPPSHASIAFSYQKIASKYNSIGTTD